ncbi:MAG: AAA family ATPase, partial [Methyloligellaceae bacterium]
HNGKSIDFRNVILIMTTNAGASELAKAAIGFNRTKREGDDEEAINRMFTPEFRNRLDATIAFSNLPPDVIAKVVDKFVFELEAQLQDRGVAIELTEEANAWLVEKGYDERFGARPLARVIQEHIKRPLADELLFGKLKAGGTVRVLVQNKDGQKGLGFEFLEPTVRPKKPSSGGKGGASSKPAKAAKTEAKKKAPKPKKGGRRPPRGSGKSGSSPVPKVPLPAR